METSIRYYIHQGMLYAASSLAGTDRRTANAHVRESFKSRWPSGRWLLDRESGAPVYETGLRVQPLDLQPVGGDWDEPRWSDPATRVPPHMDEDMHMLGNLQPC
jgi:hypothetical protein